MTGPHPEGPGPGPWRSARPELAIAATALAACAISAYAVAGGPAVVVVVTVFSAIALVVVNRLQVRGTGPRPVPDVATDRLPPTASFINYWRWRNDLKGATASMSSYRAGLGPNLEHLLAARLSERHGVSLYRQPDLARSILCPKGRDVDLWAWVDPEQPAPAPVDAPGIPPRALARLVRRLEQL